MTPARAGALIVVLVTLVAGTVGCTAGGREPSGTATASASPSVSPAVSPSPSPSPSTGPTPADPPDEATTEPEDPPAEPDSSGRSVVTVQVTFAGWQSAAGTVEVGGYADVIESDGRCVLTLTQADSSVTREVTALPDAATTSCGTISVPGTDLAPGTWSATLSYESTAATGTSEPLTIEVPR